MDFQRAHQLRNALVAITNGSITLVILLIAPLGLAAVIINTLLVTFSSYVVATLADGVMIWLLPPSSTKTIANSQPDTKGLRRIYRNVMLTSRRRN